MNTVREQLHSVLFGAERDALSPANRRARLLEVISNFERVEGKWHIPVNCRYCVIIKRDRDVASLIKAGKLRVVRQHQWNSGKSYLQIVDNK